MRLVVAAAAAFGVPMLAVSSAMWFLGGLTPLSLIAGLAALVLLPVWVVLAASVILIFWPQRTVDLTVQPQRLTIVAPDGTRAFLLSEIRKFRHKESHLEVKTADGKYRVPVPAGASFGELLTLVEQRRRKLTATPSTSERRALSDLDELRRSQNTADESH